MFHGMFHDMRKRPKWASEIGVRRVRISVRPKCVRIAPIGGQFRTSEIRTCAISDASRSEGQKPTPSLPETWGSMTVTQRLWWLHEVAGLPEITWKRRTGKFHVWGVIPSLGCHVQTAGVRTLAEAIALRERMLAISEHGA